MQSPSPVARRRFLQAAFGATALGQALAAESSGSDGLRPHFAPKARRVIFLFMTGGPSQMDLFDPKPALKTYEGQRPESVDFRTERLTGGLLPSPFKFQRYGESGTEVSELFPRLGSVADDLCVVRSMYTFNPTHTPAKNLMHSGHVSVTRPSLGSWVSYGLGTDNQNLPGFVCLSVGGGSRYLGRSGFLPPKHQGTYFNHGEHDPRKMIQYLRNSSLDARSQRQQLDLMRTLNRQHAVRVGGDDFLDTRIGAMETAYRMQFEAMDAFDVAHEPRRIQEEYGSSTIGRGCLMARRLVERGVRYVHLFAGGRGGDWDDHATINKNLRVRCPDYDQAAAALVRDLERRGLLEETLVIWGGEFGRTPVSESGDGRDHNPYGFTMWLAGGGFKPGLCYGATDQFGFQAVENRISVHDLHATILHQLGFDHERLTYRYAGRDFRLTDVHGRVVKDLLV